MSLSSLLDRSASEKAEGCVFRLGTLPASASLIRKKQAAMTLLWRPSRRQRLAAAAAAIAPPDNDGGAAPIAGPPFYRSQRTFVHFRTRRRLRGRSADERRSRPRPRRPRLVSSRSRGLPSASASERALPGEAGKGSKNNHAPTPASERISRTVVQVDAKPFLPERE